MDLIFGKILLGAESPASGKGLVIKDSYNDIGISYVDGKKHRSHLFLSYSVILTVNTSGSASNKTTLSGRLITTFRTYTPGFNPLKSV